MINLLSTNFTKWSNTIKQFVRDLKELKAPSQKRKYKNIKI